ncbi:MAG: hypothetical protein KGS61_14315, partial [Verrucomicrobia bacterium]|nr:hypothetical protein [Verrucomicrobiota bacterium]
MHTPLWWERSTFLRLKLFLDTSSAAVHPRPGGPRSSRWQSRIQTVVLGWLACCWVGDATVAAANDALGRYVRRPDASYNWKVTDQKVVEGFTVAHLELVSQTWRGQFWSHHLQLVRPPTVRNPDIALLFITGDGEGDRDLGMVRTLAERAGAIAAVLTKVPNQPLYHGRKEDALIAYTFDQYLKTGDATWPLLFPMVKSAVRAMDTVQTFAEREFHQSIKHFVVTGASKRGWTTWLTGAADRRVVAIAPIVIDMLNMKAQARWAEKVYGRQSEQIQDYTN